MLEQNLWKQLLAVTLLFGWSWTSLSEGQAAPEVVNVTKTIEFRQNLLRSIANFVPISISPQFSTSSSRPDSKLSCSELRYVFISEFPFGRSGNNLIEFTHGLWLASKLNRTLAVPEWMEKVLAPFDTKVLASQFCYEFKVDLKRSVYKDGVNIGLDLVEVTSENSFFLHKVFQDPPESPNISKSLPTINGDHIDGSLLSDLAAHFIRVYASLWSSPSSIIRTHGANIIKNHMDNSLKYVSVHKRMMEGGCSKVLGTETKPAEFDANEIPMSHESWKTNLNNNHPICDMTYSFVKEDRKSVV